MVTIFTPVYNRKYIIAKLYQSLCEQVDKSFEWIVIDDGSTDGVFDLLKLWQTENKEFTIKIKRVQNGGKHRAINMGVKMADSEAFFIVDSDDFLANDAVEFINIHFREIKEDSSFAGIAGLRCSYTDFSVIGGQPEFSDYVDATNFERKKYGLLKDKAEIYKTSCLKRFPFPEFENENFLTESIVWHKMAAHGLKIRWFNKIIYYGEYLKDGLSRQGFELYKRNPQGWIAYINDARKYAYMTPQELELNTYILIEQIMDTYSKEEICAAIHLEDKDVEKYYKKREYILETLNNLFQENEWKNVALYGFGRYAKRLCIYLQELGIKVAYIIDQKCDNIDYKPAYHLEDVWPPVDCICITLKECSQELVRKIQMRAPDIMVWSLIEKVGFF